MNTSSAPSSAQRRAHRLESVVTHLAVVAVVVASAAAVATRSSVATTPPVAATGAAVRTSAGPDRVSRNCAWLGRWSPRVAAHQG
jgi:hypothetical protein